MIEGDRKEFFKQFGGPAFIPDVSSLLRVSPQVMLHVVDYRNNPSLSAREVLVPIGLEERFNVASPVAADYMKY